MFLLSAGERSDAGMKFFDFRCIENYPNIYSEFSHSVCAIPKKKTIWRRRTKKKTEKRKTNYEHQWKEERKTRKEKSQSRSQSHKRRKKIVKVPNIQLHKSSMQSLCPLFQTFCRNFFFWDSEFECELRSEYNAVIRIFRMFSTHSNYSKNENENGILFFFYRFCSAFVFAQMFYGIMRKKLFRLQGRKTKAKWQKKMDMVSNIFVFIKFMVGWDESFV